MIKRTYEDVDQGMRARQSAFTLEQTVFQTM